MLLASWERGQPARNTVQRTETAIVPTTPMINEHFGVGVVSEPRMASAGVEPWMGSSTDKHLPRSTVGTNVFVSARKSKVVETLGACRPLWVSLFPQRVILTRFGRFVIHDSLVATPTRHSLISGVACELAARAACSEARHALAWERGQPARNLSRSKACTKFLFLNKAKW